MVAGAVGRRGLELVPFRVERVASLRRDLPPGGEVPDDYPFVAEDGSAVSLSDLFGEHETLIIYSYMFGPEREAPCPMCTSFMGGLDHKVADIRQRVAIAFTARSTIERIVEAKASRGWSDLPVYSDTCGHYTRAYVSAEDADMPAYNVFSRRDGAIRHFWSDEVTGEMADPGQDPRGAIEMDPLWLLLDCPRGPWCRLAPRPDVLSRGSSAEGVPPVRCLTASRHLARFSARNWTGHSL